MSLHSDKKKYTTHFVQNCICCLKRPLKMFLPCVYQFLFLSRFLSLYLDPFNPFVLCGCKMGFVVMQEKLKVKKFIS